MKDSNNYAQKFLENEFFQILQDRLAEEFEIASLITDINGIPITAPSNFTDFCINHTQKSKLGSKRCMACDAYGGMKAKSLKKPIIYKCHAELIDFASPILIGDKLVGCFLCGQVLADKPDEEKFIKLAKEFGIDPNEYLEAVKKIKILSHEEIEYIANFVYKISSKISNFIYYQDIGLEFSEAFKESTNRFNNFLGEIEEKSIITDTTSKEKIKMLFYRIYDTLFKKIRIDENNLYTVYESINYISKETLEINKNLKSTEEKFKSSIDSLFLNKI